MKWTKLDKEEMTKREKEMCFTSILFGVGLGLVFGIGLGILFGIGLGLVFGIILPFP